MDYCSLALATHSPVRGQLNFFGSLKAETRCDEGAQPMGLVGVDALTNRTAVISVPVHGTETN